MVQDVLGAATTPRINTTGAPAGYTQAPTLMEVIQGIGVMMRGQAGPGIKDLQAALNAAGANPPLAEDGLFGPKTDAALRKFQEQAGLSPDGRFARQTLLNMQTHQAFDPAGSWDPRKLASTTGRNPSNVAPHVEDPVPTGGVRAGDLARAEEARRRGAQPTGNNGQEIRLNSPWFSQYDRANVEGAGDSACYRAVRAMGRAAGVNIPPGTGDRIQVATGEDANGAVRTTPDRTAAARRYIDSELEAGRPVAIGVSHKNADYNQDGITDHFVLVNGRGVDEQGRQYYTYNDPATTNAANGRNNRFYVDPTSGNLVHDGSIASGYVRDRHTEMSMVVRSH